MLRMVLAMYYTTRNICDEIRNVSVTEADAAHKADLNWKNVKKTVNK